VFIGISESGMTGGADSQMLQLLKFETRKQLQPLTEYATKSVHRRPSFVCDRVSSPQSFYHIIIRGPILFQKLIWTRVIPNTSLYR
jgi:hypothetical protein